MFVPGVALGQGERPRKVDDEIGLFSKNAVEDANRTIAQIKQKHQNLSKSIYLFIDNFLPVPVIDLVNELKPVDGIVIDQTFCIQKTVQRKYVIIYPYISCLE